MTQDHTPSLFAPDLSETPVRPMGDRPERMKILITVKAAPQPSESYGETVCIAGLRLDLENQGWVRLYPINFRELESNDKFKKYEVIELDARPSHSHDPRPESWRPNITSISSVGFLKSWKERTPYISDFIETSMCGLLEGVRRAKNSRSLAAIRVKRVKDIDILPHAGWTPGEQRKIDMYVAQTEIVSTNPRVALQAPRFKVWYKYECQAPTCKGHRQGILDWELVALQMRLRKADDKFVRDSIREKFLLGMCGPDHDTVFYVGNQAKRQQVFSVLGVYYPKIK